MAYTRTERANGVGTTSQASQNRQLLSDSGIFAVDLCGSPGCGKTSLIETTLQRLSGHTNIGVIIAHPAADREIAALRQLAVQVLPVETGVITPEVLHDAINRIAMSSRRIDLLLIENSGAAPGVPAMDLGQSGRVAVFSVTAGDDKAAGAPERLRDADLVVLTKTDLLPYVRFDRDVFHKDVRRLNSKARLIELSSAEGSGMKQWLQWLNDSALELRTRRASLPTPEAAEWWFG